MKINDEAIEAVFTLVLVFIVGTEYWGGKVMKSFLVVLALW